LIAGSGLERLIRSNGWPATIEDENAQPEAVDEDESDDDDLMPMIRNRLRARRTGPPPKMPPVPNPEGRKLMSEGHFGTDQSYTDRLRRRKSDLATNLMWRELGIDTQAARRRADQLISQVSRVS
jgi:WD repeat-containing protein 23